MSNEELEVIGAAFRNLGGIFAERHRQVGQGAVPPFQFFHDSLSREATRLTVNGAPQVGDAVLALRSEIEAIDNG